MLFKLLVKIFYDELLLSDPVQIRSNQENGESFHALKYTGHCIFLNRNEYMREWLYFLRYSWFIVWYEEAHRSARCRGCAD